MQYLIKWTSYLKLLLIIFYDDDVCYNWTQAVLVMVLLYAVCVFHFCSFLVTAWYAESSFTGF